MAITKHNHFISGYRPQLSSSTFPPAIEKAWLAAWSASRVNFPQMQKTNVGNHRFNNSEESSFVFVENPPLTKTELTTSFVYVNSLPEQPATNPLSQAPLAAKQTLSANPESKEKTELKFETHATKPNEAGGNCLFYSVIDALNLDLTHAELRMMTHQYAAENKNDPQLQQRLINDACEIAADLSSDCHNCISSLQNGIIPISILNLINIRESFSLYPLIKSFPDFLKPFNENLQLINEIKQLFAAKNSRNNTAEKTAAELNTLLLAKKNEIIKLLERIKKRWDKIASLNFSENHSSKIRSDIVDCMIHDMQKIGSFGGQSALHSLSQLLECSIYIFGKNAQKNTYQETKKFFSSSGKKIHLLLSHNHYEAILEKSQVQKNQQPASGAIEQTLKILSQSPLNDLARDALAYLHLTKEEAKNLLINANRLDPSKTDDEKKIKIIKGLTEILGN